MLSYKFYVDEQRKNALMLRITNNRKKKEINLGLRWEQADLDDALSARPKPENVDKRAYLQMRIAILDKLKMELQNENRTSEDVARIAEVVRERLFFVWQAPSQPMLWRLYFANLSSSNLRSTRTSA